MKSKLYFLLGLVALALTVSLKERLDARLTGTNPTGASADTFCVGKSGSEACVDYRGDVIPTTTNRMTLGTSSLVFAQAWINTLVSASSATFADAVGVGTTTVSNAALTVQTTNASSTGVVVNAVSGDTASLQEWRIAGSTVARVGPQGHFLPRRYTKVQIDSLVPDGVGAEIICDNCAAPFSLCVGTGTSAAQWRVSSATAPASGSGLPTGCGTNN